MTETVELDAPPEPEVIVAPGAPGSGLRRLGALLVILLCVVGGFFGAFLQPTASAVPIALVAPASVATGGAGNLAAELNALPGDPLAVTVAPDRAAALGLVDSQTVTAAFVLANANGKDELIIAAANGPETTNSVVNLINQVERQAHRTGSVTVVHPLAANDSRGLAGLVLAICLVGAGLAAGLVLRVPARGAGLRSAGPVLAALAGFGVLCGLLAALLATTVFHALTGNPVLLGLIGALLVLGTGAIVLAARAVAGPVLAGVVVTVFVALGVPGAGAVPPTVLLPPLWRGTGPWLPPGAGLTAIRGAAYFAGHGTGTALLVLAGYLVVGAGAVLVTTALRGQEVASA